MLLCIFSVNINLVLQFEQCPRWSEIFNSVSYNPFMLLCLMPEWIQAYTESFIQPDKLQQIVDSFMENYDKRKEEVRTLLLFLPASPCQLVHVTSTWVCFFCHRRRRSRRRRLSSNRRTKRAGWKSQEDPRAPRRAPTARQQIRRLFRKK